MNQAINQPARERFASELERNFSVVASAGSGKTRAITERIAQIARSPKAVEWLPHLVVVTYTNRAANEMQQRARQKILEAKVALPVIAAFNRAFFGTIHSFCVKLLGGHGHFLGLPPQMELIDDDEELWNDFVQRQQTVARSLGEKTRAILFRHVEVRKLMELGRRGGLGQQKVFPEAPCPTLDFARLLAFQATGSSISTVARTQAALREWEILFREGAEFLPPPPRYCQAKPFVQIWRETFDSFRSWLNRAALAAAADVETAYREFRLTRGALTYDDQVALARALFRNDEAARRIRGKNYRVILDEAQDTAPSQFSVLLETTRVPEARGNWPDDLSDPPRPGHFCMVGDFQQSIFGHHADLKNYQRVHDALIAAPAGDAVEFSVTFRLDQKSVDLINATFGALLSGNEDQVKFVELNPRPQVLPGQVLRVELPRRKDLPPNAPERRTASWEAAEVARWIRRADLKNLRARCWSEVAILCPRKAWFQPLREALRREKFSVQIQSETEWRGDNPAYAWLTALLTIMAEPHCHYEVVGVLREIFGISDHDLAVFSGGEGYRFDLRRAQEGDNAVSAKLKLLAQIRRAIQPLPLFTAIQELITTVQLPERLRALPKEDFDNLDEELDHLLALAANAEAEGSSLADFAKILRANFEVPREPPAAEEDAIQLITAQKAKGSEWPAVIVPFLAREVRFGYSNFPRLLPASITGEPLIALSADDIVSELKEAIERVERQEMERLLYVALTRAKHTLVLVGDAELFARKTGKVPTKSQMKWLRCESRGCNEQNFARLSAEARACAATQISRAIELAQKEQEQKVSTLPKATPPSRQAADKRAHDFVRKISPSGLGEKFENENEEIVSQAGRLPLRAGAFDNEATRYGRWWHALMQRLDWNEKPERWEELFRAALAEAPERERALAEWKLFLAHAAGSGDFRKLVTSPGSIAHAEIPFLLKIDPARALEGVIDLALIDPGTRGGLIVDWKTNRIESKKNGDLRPRYRSQIAAYWKAVEEITGLTMQAGLYSSSAGSFLLYEKQELESEWTRLQSLPAASFLAAVETP